MAILTHDQLLERVRQRIGDDTSDDALSFVEDISDTFAGLTAVDNMQAQINTLQEEKKKIDADWRQKYMDRFMGKGNADPEPVIPSDPEQETAENKTSYDDLFK